MRLPSSTPMAIESLILLARDAAAEPARRSRVLVADLARRRGASRTYLAKLFQALARAGIVRSARGRRGGYALARPPAEIRIGEIVRALRPAGARPTSDASLLRLFREAEASYLRVLDIATLADLAAAPSRAWPEPARAAAVAAAEARA